MIAWFIIGILGVLAVSTVLSVIVAAMGLRLTFLRRPEEERRPEDPE